MLINGLLVDRDPDDIDVYYVTDSNRRLGGIVKWYDGPLNDRTRHYRSPWGDHDTLGEAVREFLKIPYCKPRGIGGEPADQGHKLHEVSDGK